MYDGSECAAIFGRANIAYHPNVRKLDAGLRDLFYGDHQSTFYLPSYSPGCQNFIRFIWCISSSPPCPGTVWCGSSSKEALKAAAATACSCANAEYCRAIDVSEYIDRLSRYYKGSSVTRLLGLSRNEVCQDVAVTSGQGEIYVWLRTCMLNMLHLLIYHANFICNVLQINW